ncbi:MAG TPA: alcohol dehydrogenase catalytic domain-containing protein, partial [Rhizomicrobium sp.]|nr:alcohol dehydrogenase catalytic domain-containing protein [Rhizomicrobium sp.]
MKALMCREIADGIDHLGIEDVTLPPPGCDEVRVRVRAASVNFPDLLMAQGKYQFKPELPFIVGSEASGDVIAVGSDVANFRVGDRVIVGANTGAFAQEMQVPQVAMRKMPAGVDYAEAAAFTVAYLTAYVALVRRGELRSGETLLVHGAAGGVGLAA